MSEPKTYTLEVPGAVLHYDVREGGAGHPVLLMVGAPMGASGFAALAEQFADRTVVTYDPRGTERSQRTDVQPPGSEPAEHAEDLRALIQALDAAPADIFGSSGGAVNALALVARHPALVGTLVAHEPPAAQELPDREAVLAAYAGIRQTYQASGFGPAMAGGVARTACPTGTGGPGKGTAVRSAAPASWPGRARAAALSKLSGLRRPGGQGKTQAGVCFAPCLPGRAPGLSVTTSELAA